VFGLMAGKVFSLVRWGGGGFADLGSIRGLQRLSVTLFVCAVAIHFGNYFYSALAKLTLGGGPLVWVTSNETALLMEIAGRAGFLPIASNALFAEWVHGRLAETFLLGNVFVLATQLAAVVALLRTQWSLWLTVLYDFTHIVIFIVSGIFFWKWILLNAILIAGLAKLRDVTIQLPVRFFAMILVVGANLFFVAAQLGWYDTRGFVHHYFEVVTSSNEVARVPSNFFLSASVTVAQNRLGTLGEGHFPQGTWGNTTSNDIRSKAERGCDFGEAGDIRYGFNADFIQSFVNRHHTFMLQRIDEHGRVEYDWYPHHIFSNPRLHQAFNQIDLRQVIKYRYVVESVCLDGVYGTLDQVHRRDNFEIDVGS